MLKLEDSKIVDSLRTPNRPRGEVTVIVCGETYELDDFTYINIPPLDLNMSTSALHFHRSTIKEVEIKFGIEKPSKFYTHNDVTVIYNGVNYDQLDR